MSKAIGFRGRENLEIIEFIVGKTDVESEIIELAMGNMQENDFHNADHALSVTRAAIEIGIAERRSRQEINLLALAMLFHDVGHTGIATPIDEMVAAKIALQVIPSNVLEICRENNFQNPANMLRDVIMATCFSMRGKISDSLLRVAQDADIFACAAGAVYWIYSCSGLGMEMAKQLNRPRLTNPAIFWKGTETQAGFVCFLESITKNINVFLSEGAKELWTGIARSNLNEIKSWSDEKVFQAFNLRKDDLTFTEFKTAMKRIK
jgi:hypothetical protein